MSATVVTRSRGASRPVTQGVFGVIAIILGIIGLAIGKTEPTVAMYLDAIAAIALGLALIMVGSGIAASYGRLLAAVTDESDSASGQVAGNTVGVFVGGAIIILSILALLKVTSPVLIAIDAILIGAGLLWASAASVRLAAVESDAAGDRGAAQRIGEEAVFASATSNAMAGIAVGILGILAVVGFDPATLTLIAMLVAGAALLIGGTSAGGRIGRSFGPRA